MSKYFKAEITDTFLFTLAVKAESEDEAEALAQEFFESYRGFPDVQWEHQFPEITVLHLGGDGGVFVYDEPSEVPLFDP